MDDATTVFRAQMVARLKEAGVLQTPAVTVAMARAPRHRFLPHADLRDAYLDQAVVVKHADDGSALSAASQPTIVATMLERLRVAPGHRVLEIGTGTGYNAALLADLAGDGGSVVSIELEPDLAEQARRTLTAIGEHRVEVLAGDGRRGHPSRAPYDRVIVTTGARMLAGSWVDQLVFGGRLVVPLVDDQGVGAIFVVDKRDGELRQVRDTPCGFLPMRAATSCRATGCRPSSRGGTAR